MAIAVAELAPEVLEGAEVVGPEIAEMAAPAGQFLQKLGKHAYNFLEKAPEHLANLTTFVQQSQDFYNTAKQLHADHNNVDIASGSAIKKKKNKTNLKKAIKKLKNVKRAKGTKVVEDILSIMYDDKMKKTFIKNQINYYKKLVEVFKKIKPAFKVKEINAQNLKSISDTIIASIKNITSNINKPENKKAAEAFVNEFSNAFIEKFDFAVALEGSTLEEKLNAIHMYIARLPEFLLMPSFGQWVMQIDKYQQIKLIANLNKQISEGPILDTMKNKTLAQLLKSYMTTTANMLDALAESIYANYMTNIDEKTQNLLIDMAKELPAKTKFTQKADNVSGLVNILNQLGNTESLAAVLYTISKHGKVDPLAMAKILKSSRISFDKFINQLDADSVYALSKEPQLFETLKAAYEALYANDGIKNLVTKKLEELAKRDSGKKKAGLIEYKKDDVVVDEYEVDQKILSKFLASKTVVLVNIIAELNSIPRTHFDDINKHLSPNDILAIKQAIASFPELPQGEGLINLINVGATEEGKISLDAYVQWKKNLDLYLSPLDDPKNRTADNKRVVKLLKDKLYHTANVFIDVIKDIRKFVSDIEQKRAMRGGAPPGDNDEDEWFDAVEWLLGDDNDQIVPLPDPADVYRQQIIDEGIIENATDIQRETLLTRGFGINTLLHIGGTITKKPKAKTKKSEKSKVNVAKETALQEYKDKLANIVKGDKPPSEYRYATKQSALDELDLLKTGAEEKIDYKPVPELDVKEKENLKKTSDSAYMHMQKDFMDKSNEYKNNLALAYTLNADGTKPDLRWSRDRNENELTATKFDKQTKTLLSTLIPWFAIINGMETAAKAISKLNPKSDFQTLTKLIDTVTEINSIVGTQQPLEQQKFLDAVAEFFQRSAGTLLPAPNDQILSFDKFSTADYPPGVPKNRAEFRLPFKVLTNAEHDKLLESIDDVLNTSTIYDDLADKIEKLYEVIHQKSVFKNQTLFDKIQFVSSLKMVTKLTATAPITINASALGGVINQNDTMCVAYTNNEKVFCTTATAPGGYDRYCSIGTNQAASWIVVGDYEVNDEASKYFDQLKFLNSFSKSVMASLVVQPVGLFMAVYGSTNPIMQLSNRFMSAGAVKEDEEDLYKMHNKMNPDAFKLYCVVCSFYKFYVSTLIKLNNNTPKDYLMFAVKKSQQPLFKIFNKLFEDMTIANLPNAAAFNVQNIDNISRDTLNLLITQTNKWIHESKIDLKKDNGEYAAKIFANAISDIAKRTLNLFTDRMAREYINKYHMNPDALEMSEFKIGIRDRGTPYVDTSGIPKYQTDTGVALTSGTEINAVYELKDRQTFIHMIDTFIKELIINNDPLMQQKIKMAELNYKKNKTDNDLKMYFEKFINGQIAINSSEDMSLAKSLDLLRILLEQTNGIIQVYYNTQVDLHDLINDSDRTLPSVWGDVPNFGNRYITLYSPLQKLGHNDAVTLRNARLSGVDVELGRYWGEMYNLNKVYSVEGFRSKYIHPYINTYTKRLVPTIASNNLVTSTNVMVLATLYENSPVYVKLMGRSLLNANTMEVFATIENVILGGGTAAPIAAIPNVKQNNKEMLLTFVDRSSLCSLYYSMLAIYVESGLVKYEINKVNNMVQYNTHLDNADSFTAIGNMPKTAYPFTIREDGHVTLIKEALAMTRELLNIMSKDLTTDMLNSILDGPNSLNKLDDYIKRQKTNPNDMYNLSTMLMKGIMIAEAILFRIPSYGVYPQTLFMKIKTAEQRNAEGASITVPCVYRTRPGAFGPNNPWTNPISLGFVGMVYSSMSYTAIPLAVDAEKIPSIVGLKEQLDYIHSDDYFSESYTTVHRIYEANQSLKNLPDLNTRIFMPNGNGAYDKLNKALLKLILLAVDTEYSQVIASFVTSISKLLPKITQSAPNNAVKVIGGEEKQLSDLELPTSIIDSNITNIWSIIYVLTEKRNTGFKSINAGLSATKIRAISSTLMLIEKEIRLARSYSMVLLDALSTEIYQNNLPGLTLFTDLVLNTTYTFDDTLQADATKLETLMQADSSDKHIHCGGTAIGFANMAFNGRNNHVLNTGNPISSFEATSPELYAKAFSSKYKNVKYIPADDVRNWGKIYLTKITKACDEVLKTLRTDFIEYYKPNPAFTDHLLESENVGRIQTSFTFGITTKTAPLVPGARISGFMKGESDRLASGFPQFVSDLINLKTIQSVLPNDKDLDALLLKAAIKPEAYLSVYKKILGTNHMSTVTLYAHNSIIESFEFNRYLYNANDGYLLTKIPDITNKIINIEAIVDSEERYEEYTKLLNVSFYQSLTDKKLSKLTYDAKQEISEQMLKYYTDMANPNIDAKLSQRQIIEFIHKYNLWILDPNTLKKMSALASVNAPVSAFIAIARYIELRYSTHKKVAGNFIQKYIEGLIDMVDVYDAWDLDRPQDVTNEFTIGDNANVIISGKSLANNDTCSTVIRYLIDIFSNTSYSLGKHTGTYQNFGKYVKTNDPDFDRTVVKDYKAVKLKVPSGVFDSSPYSSTLLHRINMWSTIVFADFFANYIPDACKAIIRMIIEQLYSDKLADNLTGDEKNWIYKNRIKLEDLASIYAAEKE